MSDPKKILFLRICEKKVRKKKQKIVLFFSKKNKKKQQQPPPPWQFLVNVHVTQPNTEQQPFTWSQNIPPNAKLYSEYGTLRMNDNDDGRNNVLLFRRNIGQYTNAGRQSWPVELNTVNNSTEDVIFENGIDFNRRGWMLGLVRRTVCSMAPADLNVQFCTRTQQIAHISEWKPNFSLQNDMSDHLRAIIVTDPARNPPKGQELSRMLSQILYDEGQQYGNVYCGNVHYLVQNGPGYVDKICLKWTTGNTNSLYVQHFCFSEKKCEDFGIFSEKIRCTIPTQTKKFNFFYFFFFFFFLN